MRSLKNRGLQAPEGALREPHGQPDHRPVAFSIGTPRGSIQPLGGAFGYRGTALGILVDVLAALLADDDTDDLEREGSNLAMLAIAADGALAGRAARMSAYLRSSPPLDRDAPGDDAGRARAETRPRAPRAARSAVDGPTWSALLAAAAAHRIAVPKPLPG